MGDGVSHAQAQRRTGDRWRRRWVPASGGRWSSELNIPWTHPLYRGLTGHMFGTTSRASLQDADAVLICGTYVFPGRLPAAGKSVPRRTPRSCTSISTPTPSPRTTRSPLALASDPKPTLRAAGRCSGDTDDRGAEGGGARPAPNSIVRTRRQRAARSGGAMPTRPRGGTACTCRRSPRSWRSICRPDAIVYRRSAHESSGLTRYLRARASWQLLSDAGRHAWRRLSRRRRCEDWRIPTAR